MKLVELEFATSVFSRNFPKFWNITQDSSSSAVQSISILKQTTTKKYAQNNLILD